MQEDTFERQIRAAQQRLEALKQRASELPAPQRALLEEILDELRAWVRLEEALRESERTLIESQAIGRIGSWQLNLERQSIEWSAQTYKLYERDPALGPPTVEEEAAYYSPEQAEKLREYARRASEEKTEFTYDLQASLPSGRTVHFMAKMRPVMDQNGRVFKLVGTVQDITERKQVEEVLRESKQLLERTFASLRDAVFIIDAQTVEIMDCNPAASEIFGYSRQEMLGQTTTFLHVDEAALEEFRGHLYSATEKEGFLYLPEFRMKRKDGTVFPTEHSVMPLEDEQGKRIGWVSVVRDITERKRAEEALRQSEARYRSLFDGVPVGLYRSTPQGKNLDANPAAVQMLGYPDLKSLQAASLVDMYANAEDRQRWQALMEQEGIVRDFEAQWRRRDGEIIWARDTARAVRDAEGRVLYYEGVGEDITERKRAEEALRTETTYFQQLFESAPEAIALVGHDDRILRVNGEFSRMFGYTLDEAAGHTIDELIVPDDLYEEAVSATERVAKGESVALESVRQRKDGTRIAVSILGMPFRVEGGQIARYVIYRDITERKRAEDALQEKMETERHFRERLSALHKVTIELAKAPTFDDLCRCAVELGRSHLGFDRLGIWFLDKDPRFMVGSFGTDETGQIRDERGVRRPLDLGHAMAESLRQEARIDFRADTNLYNQQGETVGRGWRAIVPLWDGEKIIGGISADNLLQRQPVSPYQLELLSLYGSTLGHLCTRKRAEETLQESEDRYRCLFEDSPISLWEEDFSAVKKHIDSLRDSGIKDFRAYFENHPDEVARSASMVKVVSVNRATLELYKAPSEKSFREGLGAVFSEESYDAFKEELLAIAEGKTVLQTEAINRTLMGDKKHVILKWSVAPGYEETLSKVIVSIMDITERKKLEEQLRQAQKMEAVGRLAGGVAHDLNNWLTAILGYTNLAMGQVDEASPLYRDLKQIEAAVVHTADTVRQLLLFSITAQCCAWIS